MLIISTKGLRREERLAFWSTHVEEYKSWSGSLAQFCRERNLSESSFSGWVNKLQNKEKVSMGQLSSFVPVVIKPKNAQDTMQRSDHKLRNSLCKIDPKWLAEFVINLSGGNL